MLAKGAADDNSTFVSKLAPTGTFSKIPLSISSLPINPSLSEADTRAKLINPAPYARGWTEEMIRREETAGTIEIIGGKARRRARGQVDYTLRGNVRILLFMSLNSKTEFITIQDLRKNHFE